MDMRVSGRGARAGARTLVERQVHHCDRFLEFLRKEAETKPTAHVGRRPVLTVSGFVGSGREVLAKTLSAELGYELFGREILDAVASDLHCQRQLLESLDERTESNIRLMFESWLHGRIIENQEYVRALFQAISSLADQGGVVILGRGGAFILGEKADLRVRVVAPLARRVQRIMEGRKISEAEARRYVDTKDEEQERFHYRHFHRDVNDPLAFDLTINTDRIEPEKAGCLVKLALAARGIAI